MKDNVLNWAIRYVHGPAPAGGHKLTPNDLVNYNRLACRGHFGPRGALRVAHAEKLYQVRTNIEQSMRQDLVRKQKDYRKLAAQLVEEDPFGASSKQGVSFRLALTSCNPSPLCRLWCYAHDGKDVLPGAIERGVKNSLLAELFETRLPTVTKIVMAGLVPHVDRALWAAVDDAQKAKAWGFVRQPRIRFAHVGDIARYPHFANAIAQMIHDRSFGQVACITYTRRRDAVLLDPSLWRVNFSLDESSMDRKKDVPSTATITYAAFDGKTCPEAYVNFAEHHGPVRCRTRGTGFVCPSTRIGKPHGCDANRCDRCFAVPKKGGQR